MKKILSLVLTLAIILGAVFTANLILAEPEAPAREGGYMHVSGRGNQNSGPRQKLGDALSTSGDGTYLFSAWVRFPGNTASKKVVIMIYPGAWPAATLEKTITDGEWNLISGEVTISGTANFANNENVYFRIQTGAALTDNWDIDFDSVVLKKKTGDTYGENLIQDSACELNPLSPWYATSATITNPDSNDTSLYGVQVEYKSDGSQFVTKKDNFNFCLNGKKAEVTVYNAGTENILLQLQVRAATWTTLGGGTAEDWVTIAAGQAATITTEIADDKVASDNWAVLVANGVGKTGKIVLCNITAQQAISLKESSRWNVNNSVAPVVVENPQAAEATPVATPVATPIATPVATPVTSPETSPETTPVATPDPNKLYGVQVEYKSDANLMINKPNKIDFCIDGKKAELTVYNAGTETIKLGLQIRTATWSTIGGLNQWIEIPAGEGKTLVTEIADDKVASDNFALLVTDGPNKTGKIIICNLKNAKATELAVSSSWNVNNAVVPTVIDNPEFTEDEGNEGGIGEAIPEPKKPDLKAEGAYITVTNRGNQNSGPIQYLGNTLKTSGDGKYYVSGWVKIPENNADKKVSIIIYCKFGTKPQYIYPTVTKTVSDGEWTLISGEIDIQNSAACASDKDAYFRIQTGTAETDKWDLWFDGITLNKKNADGTYGKNLLVNADFNKDDPATWANTTSCTITFVGVATQQPTGVIITATEETETNHIVTNTGVVTKQDIKDGKITKTFTIENQGNEPVKVTFSLQCVHKNEEGKDMWSAPEKGFTALIEPGDKQELTYTMDVNDDGTITVSGGNNDQDHKPEEFFARFDILEADGNPLVVKGTKLFILNTNSNIKFSAGVNSGITVEVVYSGQSSDTSDMIPFTAFAILPLMVAFVLVIKKRKEN